MRKLNSNANVDNSDLINYPEGRIKNNTGTGNGTPVNERVYGDLHQTISKAMRRYGILANNLPDNETNGFQILDAFKSLPSKNDFVLALTLNTGVLSVPIKIGFMDEGEKVVCKSSFDFGSETEIKGIDNINFTINVNGSFKTNEYVRLIRTSGGVDIIRLVDDISLDAMVADRGYLKKATQSEENAGVIDTKATTPKVNLVAFVKRVIGTDSVNYLATAIRNGLYSSEHFLLVEEFKKIKNRGYVSGIDPEQGTVGDTYGVFGDIASCTLADQEDNTCRYRVVMNNSQSGTDYIVKAYVQGLSSNLFSDNRVGSVVFKPINATTFDFTLYEIVSQVQNLRIHFEVVNI